MPRRRIEHEDAPQDDEMPDTEKGDPFERAAMTVTVRIAGRDLDLQAGDRLVFGRSPESPFADICEDNISFRHAELRIERDRVIIVDTDSTNGTFLNGERLTAQVDTTLSGVSQVRLANDPPLMLTVEVRSIG
jgi:pSer/pThr/pTyr-binding forkhead associated (FHA) protein